MPGSSHNHIGKLSTEDYGSDHERVRGVCQYWDSVLGHIQRQGRQPGGEYQPRLSWKPTNRFICNARSFRKDTLELYDWPSASFKFNIRMVITEVVETMLFDFVTLSPRSYHPAMSPVGSNGASTTKPHWPPDILPRYPRKYGEGCCVKVMARMEDTRLLRRVIFGELVRSMGAAGVQGESRRGISSNLDRPVGDRILKRGWNYGRESQSYTTVCCSTSVIGRKVQPKWMRSCWLVWSPQLISYKAARVHTVSGLGETSLSLSRVAVAEFN